MTSDEAIGRLRRMLEAAGVSEQRPSIADVELTWQVMRPFAAELVDDAEPADQDGDGILAQYGVYDWGDGEHFDLGMTRQFSFSDEDGEYDHMSQLNCTFHFAPTDELRAIPARSCGGSAASSTTSSRKRSRFPASTSFAPASCGRLASISPTARSDGPTVSAQGSRWMSSTQWTCSGLGSTAGRSRLTTTAS